VYVANYIPEPESLPGNITKEPYRLRLVFIRAVLIRFLVTVLAICLVSVYAPPLLGTLARKTIFLGVVLFFASAIRTVLRSHRHEPIISPWTLISVVLAVGWVARAWIQAGFPAWSLVIGIVCLCLYTAFCGRDFSFVGGYVLTAIVSSVAIASICLSVGYDGIATAKALVWNVGMLFYLVYDLASLMSRRRIGEEWAATSDLYRDIFNPLGYVPRIIHHWYRHRILNDLSFDLPFRLGSNNPGSSD
jgi:hypothetical protein